MEAVTELYHMQDSLYVIRSEIGNRPCSALRSGLLCSCRENLRINLADGFGIFLKFM